MRLIALSATAALAALSPSICCASDSSDPTSSGGGAPPPAPPAPPAAEPTAKTPKSVHIIWAAAGHPLFAPGAMLKAPEDVAEALRAAGRARPASKEEVKAATAAKRDIPDFG